MLLMCFLFHLTLGIIETSFKEFATNAFGILVRENLYNNKDLVRITQIKIQIILKSEDL